MSLEKLIESHFAPKKGKDLLVKLIEKKLNESSYYVPTPQISPALGAGGTKDEKDLKTKNLNDFIRKVLATPFMTKFKKDNSIKARIALINEFQSGSDQITIPEFVAISVFIQEFSKLIREYNSTDRRLAGYQFEILMSIFFNGTELFGTMITDFVAVINGRKENISAKFIRKQRHPEVSGNIYNFINECFSETALVYLICLKDEANSRYSFYEIFIDPEMFDDIFNWDSDRAKEIFAENPQIGIDTFIRRNTREDIREYRKRLLDRIKEVGELYREKGLELTSKSPVLFSNSFSNGVFTESSESYAGMLDFSEDRMKHTFNFYKNKTIGDVGHLFNLLGSLSKDVVGFFSEIDTMKDPYSRALMISSSIEKFGSLFYNVVKKLGIIPDVE